MAQDTEPARIDPHPPATILEWGDGAGGSPPRAGSLAGPALLRRVVGDRRLVVVVAALGGIALFASLLSEWQTTTISLRDVSEGIDIAVDSRRFSANVADLAGWGGGYLIGVFLLAGAMALVLLGPAAIRRSATLVALSTCGVLLALLVAVLSDLGKHSLWNNALELSLTPDQYKIGYGRGIYCALLGVAVVGVAAYLAGRQSTHPAAPADAPVEATEDPADTPLDLTVTPTEQFTPPAQYHHFTPLPPTTDFAPPATSWARPVDEADGAR